MERMTKLKCECGSYLQQLWFGRELTSCFVWIFKCPKCGKYWKVQLFEGKFDAYQIEEEEAKNYIAMKKKIELYNKKMEQALKVDKAFELMQKSLLELSSTLVSLDKELLTEGQKYKLKKLCKKFREEADFIDNFLKEEARKN